VTTATQHFVGGEWREGAGETIPNINPASGHQIGDVAIATADEVDQAVVAARLAFEGGWGRSSPAERRKALLRLSQLLAEDAMEIGRIGTEDNGMPLSLTTGEAVFAAEYLEFFAGWADRLTGETIPLNQTDVFDYTLREPIGVVAAIVPWNAPLSLTIWKLAPALAAGNTIVIKPSELAPLAPARLVELVAKAGLPRGVVNLVHGTGGVTGQALIEHPGVDKIAFTGGTETGRHVAATAAKTLKRVSLELGGKSANVVFADADLDTAAYQACWACFLYTGQQCIAGSRLLVERSIEEAFTNKVAAAAGAFVAGDPMQPATQVGPLISERQLERVLGFVAEARDTARVVVGGDRPGGDLANGYFVQPAVVAGVSNDMRLAREEVFGPVLSIIPFDDEADAIRIANDTPYGLAGGVWTNDLNKAHRVARGIRAGTVWVNSWHGLNPATPFGGYKASGVGREGGREVLANYTETKNVYVQLR
jgi:(Z)-2-((N-methylformamido)methylene)-5-hydroxybutyrolactone dehydrogenase